MAEEQVVITKEKIPTRKIKVKNVNPHADRLVFDAAIKQHLIRPGQEAEIEVAEPEAVRIEQQSKAGSDLRIEGHDPEEQPKPEGAPEQPEEHKSRTALAEKEAELMEAGQEADKERRESDARKSGPQLAAETGIHMHARGQAPDVVTRPADAPPKKKP